MTLPRLGVSEREDAMGENTMIIKDTSLPKLRDTKTSVAPFSITCSIGVAAIPDRGIDNWNALLESADKSLYLAKRKGRNTVVAINCRRRHSASKGRQCRPQQVCSIQ
jgi:diguanylate cyclase (GGDEF)-like protein